MNPHHVQHNVNQLLKILTKLCKPYRIVESKHEGCETRAIIIRSGYWHFLGSVRTAIRSYANVHVIEQQARQFHATRLERYASGEA